MSKNKKERNKIKRSLILGLLFMLCFIVASKVGAGTLHKPEAYRIVRHEAQPRAISVSYKNISGYRTDIGKPFTFRVWTQAEFDKIVKPNGYKLFE